MGETYTIRNYVVDLLSTLLPTYLKEHSDALGAYSNSPEFIAKLKVLTLNRVAPKYITSKKGEVFSAFAVKAPQYNADIMIALSKSASELVTEMERTA